MKTPDEFIDKYLSLFAAHGCHQASLKHFMETGKASGTFRSALHEIMTAYASQQLSALQQENDDLTLSIQVANQGIDCLHSELSGLQQENEKLRKEIFGLRQAHADNGYVTQIHPGPSTIVKP